MSTTTSGPSAPTPAAPVRLAAGDALPARSIGPIGRTDIVRYAGAGGDMNPIHHDEPFATGAGLPSVFAMGMLQGGVVAQALARWVGPEHVRTLSLRFIGQVWPGDELTVTGQVEDVTDGVARIALAAHRGADTLVVQAEATATVASA